MSKKITARVRVSNKIPIDTTQSVVSFFGDYANGANNEWAVATPVLDFRMFMRNEVAANFDVGKPYKVTFESGEGV